MLNKSILIGKNRWFIKVFEIIFNPSKIVKIICTKLPVTRKCWNLSKTTITYLIYMLLTK